MASKKMLTRSHFLKIGASLVGMGSLSAGLGCPADGGGAPDDDPDVTIADDHGHHLDLTLADVRAGQDVTYEIQGMASHSHAVQLTASQLATLRRGGQVVVSSSVAQAHSHAITIVG